MQKSDRIVRNPLVLLREEFDDWAILFDPDSGKGFGMNRTGVYLWKLLDGEHTLDALVQKIRHGTDIVPEEAPDQIGTFVGDLVGQGLAGLDKTVLAPPTSPLLFPEEVGGGAKPFPYDPPRLIHFLADRRAMGTCSHGTGDTGTCSQGATAGGTCSFTGSTAVSDCSSGGSKAGSCGHGGTAQSACANGWTPQAGACGSGTHP